VEKAEMALFTAVAVAAVAAMAAHWDQARLA